MALTTGQDFSSEDIEDRFDTIEMQIQDLNQTTISQTWLTRRRMTQPELALM